MTTRIESAWPRYPWYQIELLLCEATGQVWQGDVLLAESDRCLLVTETQHVDRLYFPEDSVRWELFEPTESHTVCPFKGEADYWRLAGTDEPMADVVWTYRTPFPEVAGLQGHVCFYDERLRVVLVRRAADGSTVTTPFPA